MFPEHIDAAEHDYYCSECGVIAEPPGQGETCEETGRCKECLLTASGSIPLYTPQQQGERAGFIGAIQACFREPQHAEEIGKRVVILVAEMQADNQPVTLIASQIEDALAVYLRDEKQRLTEHQQRHILAVVKVVLLTGGQFTSW